MIGWQWRQRNDLQAICTSLQKLTMPAPHQSDFYGPNALPDTQPTASKHWRPCIIIPKMCRTPIGAVQRLPHIVFTVVSVRLFLSGAYFCLYAGQQLLCCWCRWSMTNSLLFCAARFFTALCHSCTKTTSDSLRLYRRCCRPLLKVCIALTAYCILQVISYFFVGIVRQRHIKYLSQS